jgi:hypothetical protein
VPGTNDFVALDRPTRKLGAVMRANILDGEEFAAAARDSHHAATHGERKSLSIAQGPDRTGIDPLHQ